MKNSLVWLVIITVGLFVILSLLAGLAVSAPYGLKKIDLPDGVYFVHSGGNSPSIASVVDKANSGDCIVLWGGTYTETNVNIDRALKFTSIFGATWTGADTLFTLAADGAEFHNISFSNTNSNGIVSLGAYEAKFENCAFSCSTFDLGTDTVLFIDCDFSILQENGMTVNGGLKKFTDCRWGSEYETGNYNLRCQAGETYLYNCQMWGDSSALHGDGTPGKANKIYAYDCLFKSKGGDNYAVGIANLTELYAYNCYFFNSTANKGTVLWHDSSSVELYSPVAINSAATGKVALKGYTQKDSYIANPICGGSISIDSCDVPLSDDGLCYLDGFITTSDGISDKQLLVRFSKQRGANISGTNYASYFNIAPDSASFTAVKAIMLRDTIGVAVGDEGHIGFDSRTSGIINGIDQIKTSSYFSILSNGKLRLHNGSAWENIIYVDVDKTIVNADSILYDGTRDRGP